MHNSPTRHSIHLFLVLILFVGSCALALGTQGCTPRPVTEPAEPAPSIAPIPNEVRADINKRFFAAMASKADFSYRIKRLSFDRAMLGDAMADPVQAELYRHLTESVFVAIDGTLGKYHCATYKEGKLLEAHEDIPKEHYEVLLRLYAPFEREVLPAPEGRAMTAKEFLAAVPESISAEQKKGIEIALLRAGRNAAELIRGFNALPTEEERAAGYWLLDRMKEHAYDAIYEKMDEKRDYVHYYDVQRMSAVDFYEIVHYAFEARRNFPWAQKLDEDTFRRFVLEYRHTGEPFSAGLRAHAYRAFAPYLKTITTLRNALHQINLICTYIVEYRQDMYWEDQDLRMLMATNQARCEGKSNFASEMLRAAGVPNGYVSTPFWARIDGNHAWNLAFEGEDVLSFMGCAENKNELDFDMYKKSDAAKIYLREPNGERRDMTDFYVDTVDLPVDLGKEFAGQEVFLQVFNHSTWRSVARATVDDKGTVTFPKVGHNSDYLLAVSTVLEGGNDVITAFVMTGAGEAEALVVGEPSLAAATLGATKPNMEAGKTYVLATWKGDKWCEAARVTADKNGDLALKGEKSRLYILMGEEDSPIGRPFQFVEDKDGAKIKRF